MEPRERAELEAWREWVAAAPGGVVESAKKGSAFALRSARFRPAS